MIVENSYLSNSYLIIGFDEVEHWFDKVYVQSAQPYTSR